MKAEEWERIKGLFDAALQRDRTTRLAWLQEACAGRPDLLETVSQLIHDYEDSALLDLRTPGGAPVFSAGDLVAGRFLVLRLIAHGGMGEVYEVTDNSLRGIKIALKTLRPGIASEQEAYERFKREVWVAREVAHPGICRVFDLVEHKKTHPNGMEITIPCLTMSLLEGESLAAHRARVGPLSASDALPIVRQLAECIQAMHDNKIVHRDIKPSNIMLLPREGTSPQVVLIDFGLAKPVNARSDAWQTKTQQAQAGSPYFLAPEILCGEPAGPQVDVYGLGLVIDDLVTSQPAYRFDSMEELFWRKLHEAPLNPCARSAGLPRAWQQAILQCLERDPDKRPSGGTRLLALLEAPEPLAISCALRRTMQAFRPHRRPFSIASRRNWIAGACLRRSRGLPVLVATRVNSPRLFRPSWCGRLRTWPYARASMRRYARVQPKN